MRRFQNPLQVELQEDRKTWRLLALFSYSAPGVGLITVTPNFETDFASVRPLRTVGVLAVFVGVLLGLLLPWVGSLLVVFGLGALLLYAAVVTYGQEAAVIHDYLYAVELLPRRLADSVFRDALRSSGHARWRSWTMWAGVRIGGRWRYGSVKRGPWISKGK